MIAFIGASFEGARGACLPINLILGSTIKCITYYVITIVAYSVNIGKFGNCLSIILSKVLPYKYTSGMILQKFHTAKILH